MKVKELIEKIANLDRVYGEKYYVALEDVLDLVKHLDEPQKVVVPQFVAGWIDYFKKYSGFLYGSIAPYSYYGHAITDDFVGDVKKTLGWIRNNSETYARAWLDGYEVEKKKLFKVRLKGTSQYLCNDDTGLHFQHGFKTDFTKEYLEQAGFGWVFDCEGIEIEEVE